MRREGRALRLKRALQTVHATGEAQALLRHQATMDGGEPRKSPANIQTDGRRPATAKGPPRTPSFSPEPRKSKASRTAVTQRRSLRSHRPGQGENRVLFFAGHSGAFHSAPAPVARGREVAKPRAECGRAPPPPALRSTRLRTRPAKKVLVVRASTRGFPPASLADVPAIRRGATTQPARGRAPLPRSCGQVQPQPQHLGAPPRTPLGVFHPQTPERYLNNSNHASSTNRSDVAGRES